MAAAISGSTVAADNSPVVNVDNIADNASSASAAISSRGSSWSSAGKGTFVEALFDAFEEKNSRSNSCKMTTIQECIALSTRMPTGRT